MKQPSVIDNDSGEITIKLGNVVLRSWSYNSREEQLINMLCAREYVEGWCDRLEYLNPNDIDELLAQFP